MDRNSITGFILIFVLVFVYIIYNQKEAEKTLEKQGIAIDSVEQSPAGHAGSEAPAIDEELPASVQNEVLPDSIAADLPVLKPLEKLMQGALELDTIENDKVRVVLSNKGGSIYSVEVKGYKTFYGDPLVLFGNGDNKFGFGLPGKENYYQTDTFFFEREGEGFSISGNDSNSISYTLHLGDGQDIRFTYSLTGSSDFLRFTPEFKGIDRFLASRQTKLTLNWQTKLRLQEREYKQERRYTEIYYRLANSEDVEYISGDEVKGEAIKFPIRWAAFKQQFFNSTLVADDPFFLSGTFSMLTPAEDSYLKYMSTKLYLPFNGENEVSYHFRFYFGPNGYSHLKDFGLGMEEMVPLGSWGLDIVNKWLIIPVFEFFSRFTQNYGIIILLLAIFIKIILSPLTYKSFKSSAAMRVLKPEIQEIQEKYKGDAQKIQMEQMKLYQKTGVSMFGGCLPMLLQMPILIAMYRFFPASIHLRQAEFLWATDLSTYDSIYQIGQSIPFYGDHVSLFTILMAASSILYARFNQQMTPQAGANPTMKYMPYIMPVFLIFIFNSLPAGLTYYYFLYNILSFAQQVLFNKFLIDEDKIRAKLEERKRKPKKKSKWQQRLEEMQQMQQAQKKQGRKR